jgi:hypothetical protein
MDMGEITRQELDAKIDAIKSWGDARFAEQRAYTDTRFAKIDAQFAEQRAYMDTRFARIDTQLAEQRANTDVRFAEIDKRFVELRADINTRFAEQSLQLEKQLHAMTRWLVGTMIALFALTITIMALMVNVTVNVLNASGYDADSTDSARAHYAPALSLHRFQRHHQAAIGRTDPRRHKLHAGVAQVFHPE